MLLFFFTAGVEIQTAFARKQRSNNSHLTGENIRVVYGITS